MLSTLVEMRSALYVRCISNWSSWTHSNS